jgi:hypothetical protein
MKNGDFEAPAHAVFAATADGKRASALETYVAWLATQYEGPGFHLIAHHFDLAGYRTQLLDGVRTGRLGESEASRFYFIAALSRARKMSQVLVDNNVCAAKLRHLRAKLKSRETGDEIDIPEIDENEVRSNQMRRQTAQWQELSAQIA